MNGSGGEAGGPGRPAAFRAGDASLYKTALIDSRAFALGFEQIGVEGEDSFVGGEALTRNPEGSLAADSPEDGGSGGSEPVHWRISCSRRSMAERYSILIR